MIPTIEKLLPILKLLLTFYFSHQLSLVDLLLGGMLDGSLGGEARLFGTEDPFTGGLVTLLLVDAVCARAELGCVGGDVAVAV